VNTTGVSELFNPVRFGADFANRVANPKDVLVFHRAAKKPQGGAKKQKIEGAS
jgi:double-strand break repair protein MRE11